MVDTTVSDDSLIDSEIDFGEVFGSLGGAKTCRLGFRRADPPASLVPLVLAYDFQ